MTTPRKTRSVRRNFELWALFQRDIESLVWLPLENRYVDTHTQRLYDVYKAGYEQGAEIGNDTHDTRTTG
jgi:hypothetical protein